MNQLPIAFFERTTPIVAKELLGHYLYHHSPDGITGGKIIETEAYLGPTDPACHSFNGLTPRCKNMFGMAGRVYVYRIYGIHHCFNITSDSPEIPAAVLIRALEPVEGIPLMEKRRKRDQLKDLCSGPGKLAIAMDFQRKHDGISLFTGPVRVYQGETYADNDIVTTTRVGISKAADWPLRYYVKDHPLISKK